MTLKINGVEIPESAVKFELNRLVKFYSAHMSNEELGKQMPLLKKKACEQAIGARLLIDEANARGVTVSEDDVDKRMAELMQRSGGEEKFQDMLARQGLNMQQVRDSIRQGMRVDSLVEEISEGAEEPTEEEMREYFEAHRGDYKKEDQVQVRHVLITPDSDSEQDRQVARSKLSGIRQRISEGADFADEAAMHSHCPSGKKSGGSLGWISRGIMVPEFDRVLFDTQVGELSEIVETPLGFHLVNKTEEEAGGPADFEDVKEKIRDLMIHARRGEKIKAYVEELKKKAVIEEV